MTLEPRQRSSAELLPVGARIRHRRHPELTGRIKAHEYNRPGVLSPIPYCIEWDSSGRACDMLGWFFVYATDETVEVLADA